MHIFYTCNLFLCGDVFEALCTDQSAVDAQLCREVEIIFKIKRGYS